MIDLYLKDTSHLRNSCFIDDVLTDSFLRKFKFFALKHSFKVVESFFLAFFLFLIPNYHHHWTVFTVLPIFFQVHEPRLPTELLCSGEVWGLLMAADLLHVFVSKHALSLPCFDCTACGVHKSVLHYYC